MTEADQQELGRALWAIADDLRGAMNADDFRDYMLSFLFLRYLSDNYEAAVKKELGTDYPQRATGKEQRKEDSEKRPPLLIWYMTTKQTWRILKIKCAAKCIMWSSRQQAQ